MENLNSYVKLPEGKHRSLPQMMMDTTMLPGLEDPFPVKMVDFWGRTVGLGESNSAPLI